MVTKKKTREPKKNQSITTKVDLIYDHFLNRYPTACGVPDAPAVPNEVSYTGAEPTLYTQWLSPTIHFIKNTFAAGGMLFGSMNILTHPSILGELRKGNVSFLIDKYKVPLNMLNIYNNMYCTILRTDMPGKILSHLTRRPTTKGTLNDYGLMDAVRFVGVLKTTHMRKENENRPIHHDNFMIAAYPEDKGKYVPTDVWVGSPNLSGNAETSHESVQICTDAPNMAEVYFSLWSHYYSLSEDIVGISYGVSPQYWWNSKKQRYSKIPTCKSCGFTSLSNRWYTNKGKNHLGFWCPACYATMAHKQ